MRDTIKLISAALIAMSMSAQAAVTIEFEEVGNDVVVTGKGSIDSFNGTTALGQTHVGESMIFPTYGLLKNGSDPYEQGNGFAVTDVPIPYGAGTTMSPNIQDGSQFGVTLDPGNNHPGTFFLPLDYSLSDPIEFSMRFTEASFDDLGVTPGMYVWRWGTQDDGDFISICIGSCDELEPPIPAVPTPVPSIGAFGLIGLAGAIGATSVIMTRRRKR